MAKDPPNLNPGSKRSSTKHLSHQRRTPIRSLQQNLRLPLRAPPLRETKRPQPKNLPPRESNLRHLRKTTSRRNCEQLKNERSIYRSSNGSRPSKRTLLEAKGALRLPNH